MRRYPLQMDQHNSAPNLDGLRRIAAQQLQGEQFAAAQRTLEELVQHAPDDIPSHMELARVLAARGYWRASSEPLLKATRHLSRDPRLLLGLTRQLMDRSEVVAARQCLDQLARESATPASLLVTQARLRFQLGEIPTALDLTERALAAGADTADDHYLHAMLLQFAGELDGACNALVRCLARAPQHAEAAMVLAELHAYAPRQDVLALVESRLRQLAATPATPDESYQRACLEYARFRLLDDAGEQAQAWAALARGNTLMHEINPYDAAATDALVDALIEFSPTGPRPASPDTDGPTPIFIVGMPRSGTTLLERIVSNHLHVAAAGELYDFWRQFHWCADVHSTGPATLREAVQRAATIDYAELGARYLRQTQWRAGGRRFYVDKLPANIELVAFIRQALPHAPILHIRRPAIDVCFSNLKAWFGNALAYSYHQASVAHYHNQYQRLVDVWHERIPDAMLDVDYADLVEATAPTVERILGWCGLETEADCLRPERNPAPAVTPASAQARAPAHRRGNDRWRAYADELQPLRDALTH